MSQHFLIYIIRAKVKLFIPNRFKLGLGREILLHLLLRQSEVNTHWLDSPGLALQDTSIFVGNDVILRH